MGGCQKKMPDSMLAKLDELYRSISKQKPTLPCSETVRSAAEPGTDQKEGDWCQVLRGLTLTLTLKDPGLYSR